MLSPGVQESCMNLTHDRLEPNPDISGIGVLISFTATAFMVLLLVWAKYLISFDPGKNPFQPGASLGAVATTTTPCRSWHSNTADESFLAFCRSLGARLAGCLPRSLVAFRSADFDEAFDETIVAMCDMQIFTGGGILLSGFLTLRDKISAHHWHVLVYLAWFSTTSHLAGLTAIRSYLNAFPRKRNLRLGLMLIVLAMLLAAMVPTQFLTWDDAISVYLHDSPALCFFDLHLARRMWHKAVAIRNHERYGITTASEADEAMAKGTQGVVLSALVLVLGLFIRSLKIFSPLSGFFAQRVRRKLREFSGRFLLCLRPHRLIGLEAQDKKPSFLHAAYAYCLFLPAVATFFSLRLWLDLFCSVMAQMLWFLISMLWGLGKLVEARRHGFSQTEAEESRWTFGQTLSILLLASPLFNLLTILASSPKGSPTATHVPRPADLADADTCTCDSQWKELVSRVQPGSRRPLSEDSKESMVHLMHHRGYFKTASWLEPTVIMIFTVISATSPLIYYENSRFILDAGMSWGSFRDFATWIASYFIFALFPGTVFTILYGIQLDAWLWFDSRRRVKRGFFFALSSFIYGILIFGIQIVQLLSRPESFKDFAREDCIAGFSVTIGIYLAYILSFLGIFFRHSFNCFHVFRRQ